MSTKTADPFSTILTDEERYMRRIHGLRVVESMLLQAANSGQAPNEEALEAASGVVCEALTTFEELGVLDLVCDRDMARSAGGSGAEA